MTNATRRVAAIALGATLMFAACSSSAGPAAPAAAGTAAATSAATTAAATTAASTPTPTSTPPSTPPAADLSGLAGDWVASMEDVRLNYATGKFVESSRP